MSVYSLMYNFGLLSEHYYVGLLCAVFWLADEITRGIACRVNDWRSFN